MNESPTNYRFRLRQWLSALPTDKRSLAIRKITAECNQGKHTIKRIMYMRKGDKSYVRSETKVAICNVFRKELSELENNDEPEIENQTITRLEIKTNIHEQQQQHSPNGTLSNLCLVTIVL